MKRLQERLNESQERFAEVKEHFGVNHPEYRKAAASIRELGSQVDSMRQNIMRRVEVEFQEARNREGMLEKSVA